MIESVIVIFLLCLVFLALFQFSDLFTTRLMLDHAAARAARAKAVGLNSFMAVKTARVATIPVAGERLTPSADELGALNGTAPDANAPGGIGKTIDAGLRLPAASPEAEIELGRVPAYLAAENQATANGILDYRLWEDTDIDFDEDSQQITATISQRHPLMVDFEDLEGGGLRDTDKSTELEGSYTIESHYPFYLEDAGL